MAIKFKELKKYISRVVRLSICFKDGHYENYILPSDIPDGKYDDLFVLGVGTIDVEFPLDVYEGYEKLSKKDYLNDGFFFGCGLEIVVQEEPGDIERTNKEHLTFGDLRNYLQRGGNFSILTKENWSEESYEYCRDISHEYDKMYVYGIGIEDNLKALNEFCGRHARIDYTDGRLFKKMQIVLSEKPRT